MTAKTSRLRSPFTWLLAAYFVLAISYSIVTPPFEASDELWHYPFVKALADRCFQLPVQNPGEQTTWRQEGSQPPLYYLMGAALTFWIDTSDFDQVRVLNPHSDIGMVLPDGNYSMAIRKPGQDAFPWHGTRLAIQLVRLLSVALGAVTVAMTYLLTGELFPGRRGLALAAAAFTAFNPMFLFISGSVNNDNLSTALGAVLLVLIVRLLKRTTAAPLRDLVLIGVVTGAALLSKLNIGFLIPLIALSLLILAIRLRDWRPFVIGGLVTGGLTILIAGWWYLRNIQLYGDPTGLNVFLQIVGRRIVQPNVAQLWSERHTFLMSYWGFFGGVNLPLPDVVYTIFNGMATLGILGLLIALMRSRTLEPDATALRTVFTAETANSSDFLYQLADEAQEIEGVRPVAVEPSTAQASAVPAAQLARDLLPKITGSILLGRAFTAVWIVVLFVSLLRWTSETWASQGRLMFAALAPISMWLAYGLWQFGQPLPLVRQAGRYLLSAAALWHLIAAVGAAVFIWRAYSFPYWNYDYAAEQGRTQFIASFYEPGKEEPAFQVGVLQPGESVRVGEFLQFCERFAMQGSWTVQRDWSAFIHLENEDGVIVAQRDTYLGQGLWPSSMLSVARTQIIQRRGLSDWCNYFAVRIPEHAYAPQQLKVYLGFYDHTKPSERMIIKGRNITDDNRLLLGRIDLLPRQSPPGVPSSVPNPMRVNFGNEVELVGYEVSDLVMYPHKKIKVTFYWRAMHPLNVDYRVFTQIIHPRTTLVYGGSDAMPAAWSRPTTTWQPGEIVKDEHTITVFPHSPPGTWLLHVGVYQHLGENNFRRLRVITPEGGEADEVVPLTRLKITLPPEPF